MNIHFNGWPPACSGESALGLIHLSLIHLLFRSVVRSFIHLLGQSVSISFTYSYTPAACTGENLLELIHLSLIHLLVCSIVRSFIHPFIYSVSQSVYHSCIYLFVCSYVHSSIHFFRQSVGLLRQNGRRVTKVYWLLIGCILAWFFLRRGGGGWAGEDGYCGQYPAILTSHLANNVFFLSPRPRNFNCVAALPQLKSYLL